MDYRIIRAYLEANRRVMSENRHLPVGVITTFLGAALWGEDLDSVKEPMTLEELGANLGLTPTTISQHLRYLSYGYLRHREGLGLVVTAENLDNRRKKVFFLTPKGRALIGELEAILRAGMRPTN